MTILPVGRERHYHVNDPFMNYQTPKHVYRNAGKRLLGFLQHGVIGRRDDCPQ